MHRDICKTVKAARAFYVHEKASDAAVRFERAHQWLFAQVYHPPGEKYYVVTVYDDKTKQHLGYML